MSTGQLPAPPGPGQPAQGSLSPDRNWYWNGGQWSPALSPDGHWRWNGSGWEVAIATAPLGVLPYESAGGRATFVLISFAVFGVGLLVSTAGDLLALGALATRDVNVVIQGLGGVIVLVVYLLCIVSFCLWIHRANRNLRALGVIAPRFTPRWAVGWFFVPFANLFRPLQVVREIWQGSVGTAQSLVLVTAWWAMWLISNYADNIAARIVLKGGSNDAFDAATNVMDGIALVLAVLVVWRITGAQDRLAQGTAAPRQV